MRAKSLSLLLALLLLLPGCGAREETVEEMTLPTEPGPTVAVDGTAGEVTEKGTYTAQSVSGDRVVASIGDAVLTNGQLQVYYWLEVASYRQADRELAPDFDRPLDTQTCPLDETVNTWQQYFLKRALNTWHSAQALVLQSREVGLPLEEAYQPDEAEHEIYMTDAAATRVLYGYENNYHMNALHQTYLEELPQTLEKLAQEKGFSDGEALAEAVAGATAEDLLAFAQVYNTGYAYFTGLTYYIQPQQEDVESWAAARPDAYADDGTVLVDIRQILVIPQGTEEDPVTVAEDGTVTASQEAWDKAEKTARKLLAEYERTFRQNQFSASKSTADAVFADYAHSHSQDPDTAPDGGRYYHLRQGQLPQALDQWCFDSDRQVGDTTIVASECGYHILFFSGSVESWYQEAQEDLTASLQAQAVQEARQRYPMTVAYGDIALGWARQTDILTAEELLYGDVAHERYTEMPLYLQQDYGDTLYGKYPLSTHGCGPSSMAMVGSYMTDTELTPAALAQKYGKYCYVNGSDGSFFCVVPSELGFYLKEKTYDYRVAKAALEEGHIVVCVQHGGSFTTGGHYITLEKVVDSLEGDTDIRIQVRDSNMHNYDRLEGHQIDSFPWATIRSHGACYWVFEYKLVNIPSCDRCGDPSGTTETLLTGEHLCHKCGPALLRRNTYLETCAEDLP